MLDSAIISKTEEAYFEITELRECVQSLSTLAQAVQREAERAAHALAVAQANKDYKAVQAALEEVHAITNAAITHTNAHNLLGWDPKASAQTSAQRLWGKLK